MLAAAAGKPGRGWCSRSQGAGRLSRDRGASAALPPARPRLSGRWQVLDARRGKRRTTVAVASLANWPASCGRSLACPTDRTSSPHSPTSVWGLAVGVCHPGPRWSYEHQPHACELDARRRPKRDEQHRREVASPSHIRLKRSPRPSRHPRSEPIARSPTTPTAGPITTGNLPKRFPYQTPGGLWTESQLVSCSVSRMQARAMSPSPASCSTRSCTCPPSL